MASGRCPDAIGGDRTRPICLDHIVPLSKGQTLSNVIGEYVESAELKIYDGLYHWMRQDMMDDVRDFIEQRVF